MRILFLSDNFPPESNAPAARIHEHAKYWVAAGHEVTVITCAPNFPEGRVYKGYRNAWHTTETVDGIRVIRVKTFISANEGFVRRTLDYLSFAAAAVFAGLFERRPDVVVATTPQFFCAVGGWMLAALRRLPFVLELRDLWPASIAAVGAMRPGFAMRMLERLELFLYRRAAVIVSVTQAFREDLVGRGIDNGKIHVVLNGADLSWCWPRPRAADIVQQYGLQEKFVVGYLGTHGMAHALPRVLEAAARLAPRKDIVLVFAGSGAARAEVERIVQQRGLANVHLIPRQPKEAMGALWSICDASLMPLRDDPLFATVIPSKLFEAMGNGVPTIASLPEGEATQLVRWTGCGLIVQPEQPDDLAAAIETLADDRDLWLRLRQAALDAAPDFSRAHMASCMVEILQKAVHGKVESAGGLKGEPMDKAGDEPLHHGASSGVDAPPRGTAGVA
ncbi:glycosyl transferase family 1 [Steroidobacter denitrificans]|uniref:Glycosyl transferase family 1 n=1 Tax=Steroidobacter denitrificans TaxID=465721 RepID=A0A127FBE2_STEDE|nr:glycosyltransferase family 4 protein [Steroidobacter denitrificans]AMN46915.1 glycosyl transferase family 1 [Steroidobacter denitrificans]